jgi:hypothetical protein
MADAIQPEIQKINGVLEKLSLFSPLIVVTGVFMSAVFSSNLSKGLTYLMITIIAVLLRHTAMNPYNFVKSLTEGNLMSGSEQQTGGGTGGGRKRNRKNMIGGAIGDCNMGIGKYGDDETLGLFILSFTMLYICTPMFIINSINWYILVLFIFYIVADYYAKMTNKCYEGKAVTIFANIVAGVTIGTITSLLIYTYQNDWSMINVTSSNKQVCSMNAEQTFKCGVYKNGELIASTGN